MNIGRVDIGRVDIGRVGIGQVGTGRVDRQRADLDHTLVGILAVLGRVDRQLGLR